MGTVKEQFIAELNPLLREIEHAVNGGNRTGGIERVKDVLLLVDKYASSGRLTREEIRECLNNPTATTIARRLGVKLQ